MMSMQEEDKGYQPIKDDLDRSDPPQKDTSCGFEDNDKSSPNSEESNNEPSEFS